MSSQSVCTGNMTRFRRWGLVTDPTISEYTLQCSLARSEDRRCLDCVVAFDERAARLPQVLVKSGSHIYGEILPIPSESHRSLSKILRTVF